MIVVELLVVVVLVVVSVVNGRLEVVNVSVGTNKALVLEKEDEGVEVFRVDCRGLS